MKNFIDKVFSVKRTETEKIINILGIKIKFNRANAKIDEINKNLKIFIDYAIKPENLAHAQGYLRVVQSINFEILCKVDEICRKHNINYWLDAGTLLGAVRHKGFIPWDDDLDLGMLHSDYVKFCSIIDEELKGTDFLFKKIPSHIGKILHKDFLPQNNQEWLDFVNWSKGEKLFVALDIFPYYNLKEEVLNAEQTINKFFLEKRKLYKQYKGLEEYSKIDQKMNFAINKIASEEKTSKMFLGLETIAPKARIFKTEDIFPLKEITFENKKFFVPNNFKNILQIYYDDFMKPKIMHSHLNFDNICKEDKFKLLQHLTIEEKEGTE
jgi:lipopolysaccharide cholinephosphotransferase